MRSVLVLLILLAGARASTAAPAQELFVALCAACHGKDGKGNTPAGKKAGAKDLTISQTSRAEVEKQIVQGKPDAKGVLKMPAFGGKISNQEVNGLTDYVLGLRKSK